jgi:hypothetical protein
MKATIYLRLREARQASKLNGAEAGLDRGYQNDQLFWT